MRQLLRKHHRLVRHFPRRRHLKNSWLHRILGERLFARELWKPARKEVAGGLALGLLVGFTPTMGAQIVICGVLAYVLRVNVPVAIAGTFVTNPFTAALIYPLLYQVGVWLAGVPSPSELEGYGGTLRTVVRYAKPLWIGSLVAGSVAAALGYGLVMLLWKEAEHLQSARHRNSSRRSADSLRKRDEPTSSQLPSKEYPR